MEDYLDVLRYAFMFNCGVEVIRGANRVSDPAIQKPTFSISLLRNRGALAKARAASSLRTSSSSFNASSVAETSSGILQTTPLTTAQESTPLESSGLSTRLAAPHLPMHRIDTESVPMKKVDSCLDMAKSSHTPSICAESDSTSPYAAPAGRRQRGFQSTNRCLVDARRRWPDLACALSTAIAPLLERQQAAHRYCLRRRP